jgi:hypothetical protein
MQKYQGNSKNAPRETFIGDQRHMLAYINPFEEDLLRNYGGTGQKGPGGVPAFRPVKGKDSSGKPSAGTGFSGGSSNNNSGGGGGGNPGDIASGGYGTGNSGGNAGGGGGGGSNNNNEPNRPPVGTGNGGGNNNNNNSGGGGGNNNNVGVASSTGTTATRPVVPSGQTQAQSAMNQYGSRANNPQTVSETLMAQQSLRDLASTSTPPIQSMTQTAQLGTNDAGPQLFSMSSNTETPPPLSDLELSLEFDEDYQDAKSQLEAAGYVVDENGIVRTTTGVSVGTLSEVVNFGRANPSSGGAAGVAAAAPKLDVAPGTVSQVVAPPVSKAGPPVNQGIASVGTNYGFDVQLFQKFRWKVFTQQIQTLQKNFKTP